MKYPCPKCGVPMTRGPKAASGKLRWECSRPSTGYCYSTTNPKAGTVRKQDGSTVRKGKTPIFTRALGGVTRFIVTAAQNATPAHKGFIKAIETACDHLNAVPLVIPLRYKNPTSRWSESQANEEVWADEVQPYLFNARRKLNKNLVLLGDVKVQPTAIDPLAGFEALTHGESSILAHTKLALKTVPTPQNSLPKILTTSGACTVANYTDSKAGALGSFHHTLGAAMVDIRGKVFHLRQINAKKDTGSFIDLDNYYGINWNANGIGEAPPAEALIMGDLHRDYADPKALRATNEMITLLKPRVLVWHDVDDAHTISPHHRLNPFAAIAKIKAGRTSPEEELYRSIDLIADMTPDGVQSVVVFSNHPEMLARWIRDTDWKHQPGNADFYLKTALMMAEQTRLGKAGIETPDPFNYWGRKYAETTGKNIRFLEMDESFMLRGTELGMHGHKGQNGARGSLRGLRRVGVKFFIGHGHGPGISEGGMQVGTLTRLHAEYTAGPGGWLNTNGVLYGNAKRSLLNVIKGDWRL